MRQAAKGQGGPASAPLKSYAELNRELAQLEKLRYIAIAGRSRVVSLTRAALAELERRRNGGRS